VSKGEPIGQYFALKNPTERWGLGLKIAVYTALRLSRRVFFPTTTLIAVKRYRYAAIFLLKKTVRILVIAKPYYCTFLRPLSAPAAPKASAAMEIPKPEPGNFGRFRATD